MGKIEEKDEKGDMMKKKKGYWSVYDLQTNRNLATGMNSPTLKEAVEDVWEWWIGGSDLEDEDREKMEKWSLKEKKNWLEGQEFKFEKSSKKLEEVW